jgi:hypothetical protein
MVNEAKSWEEFSAHLDGKTDACGRPSSPLSLLILSVLRVIGRNITFDDIAEVTNISEETLRIFFHKFVKKWSEVKYPELVKAPETQEEFIENEFEYKRAGFNGCHASIDCVHIRWDATPFGLKNISTGKEGYVHSIDLWIEIPVKIIFLSIFVF